MYPEIYFYHPIVSLDDILLVMIRDVKRYRMIEGSVKGLSVSNLSVYRGSIVFKTLRSSVASFAKEVELTSEEVEELKVSIFSQTYFSSHVFHGMANIFMP